MPLSQQFSYELYFGDASDAALFDESYISSTSSGATSLGGAGEVLVLRFYVREMPNVSSVTLKLTTKDAEGTKVTIEQTYAVTPQKIGITDPITVYISVEKLTVQQKLDSDSYYLVEPQAFTIDSSWNAARVIVELLNSYGLAYKNTGAPESNFYLSAIWDGEENSGAGGYLSEFSYGGQSGWMYSVNHFFPGLGSTDWVLVDGDVVRWQYTCEGLGEDLGAYYGVDAWSANKTMLLREYAQLVAAGSSNEHLAYALSVLQTLNPTQETVDRAYALLTGDLVLSCDATLAELSVDGVSVSEFDSEVTSYTVTVEYETVSVVVTGVVADAGAMLSVAGPELLVVGENMFTVTVTAEDDTTTKEYAIIVVREAAPVIVVSAAPEAFVTQLNGNKNNLTITIIEELSDGTTNAITETFSITNNVADTYTVGNYKIYVDTKGNTQIRDCYIIT